MEDLKVGDKVELLGDYCGFKKGQVVELYKLGNDEMHLFKGPNDVFSLCDGAQGAYLERGSCKLITPIADKKSYGAHGVLEAAGENKPHPHADLMLKYAMIAQYDDKPWESFECDMGDGKLWCDMITTGFQRDFKYRLKLQEPVVQIGQIWMSKEGIVVLVSTIENTVRVGTIHVLGGIKIHWSFSRNEFLQSFKRKEKACILK